MRVRREGEALRSSGTFARDFLPVFGGVTVHSRPYVQNQKSLYLAQLLLVLDICVAAFVFVVTFQIRQALRTTGDLDFWAHLALLPFVLFVYGRLMWSAGAYQQLHVASVVGYAWVVIRSVALTIAVTSTVIFLLDADYASRAFIVLFAVSLVLTHVLVRATLIWWYFKKSVEHGTNFLKIVVIGTGERARVLSDKLLSKSEWGIEVVGYLDTDEAAGRTRAVSGPVLGHVSEIAAVLEKHVVDEVIIAMPRRLLNDLQVIADVCEEEGVRLRLMADFFDVRVARTEVVQLDEIPLLTFEPVAFDQGKLLVKRIIDIVLVMTAMPLLLPLLAVIALAIRLDSPGPVLFKQQRVGLRKRLFTMYKFRSMYQDAEQRMQEVEHLNEAEGPIFKIANDPRVTRVGRFIRRTSLDELPQLFNVFRGHMSLVGPRPMSLRDVGLFDQSIQRKRFSVRPGLTCLWQVSGRSNLPFSKWLELDLAYIDNWSLALDFRILLKTIPVVLKGSGAV